MVVIMNYPNKKKIVNENYIYYGKRGMNLEDDINSSNKYFLLGSIGWNSLSPIGWVWIVDCSNLLPIL